MLRKHFVQLEKLAFCVMFGSSVFCSSTPLVATLKRSAVGQQRMMLAIRPRRKRLEADPVRCSIVSC